MALSAMAELPCLSNLSGCTRPSSWSRDTGRRVTAGQPFRVRPKSVVQARAEQRSQPGSEESRAVLDAFFLGKALAEAVTERIGNALGEFLSDVGRLQAEQQKTVREFQEEVQDRARKAIVNEALELARGASKGASTTPPAKGAAVIERPIGSS